LLILALNLLIKFSLKYPQYLIFPDHLVKTLVSSVFKKVHSLRKPENDPPPSVIRGHGYGPGQLPFLSFHSKKSITVLHPRWSVLR